MRFRKGHKYIGEAIELKPYGAILKMEDGSTHLLHISNISEHYVSDVSDYITVGDKYEVTAVPGTVKSIELTLKDVEVSEFYEDGDEDDDSEEDFASLLEQYLPRPDHRDRKTHRHKYNKDKYRQIQDNN